MLLNEQVIPVSFLRWTENKKVVLGYRGKTDKIPLLIVIVLNKAEHMYATLGINDLIVSKKDTLISAWNKFYKQADEGTKQSNTTKVLDAIRDFRSVLGSAVDSVKVTKGLKELWSYYGRDLQIYERTFVNIFGFPPPQEEHDIFTKVDGMKIFIPDAVQSKQYFISAAMNAKQALQKYGFAYLIEDVPMKVRKLDSGFLGLYKPEFKELSLNQDYPNKQNDLVNTIIHELGHHLYYNHMSSADKTKVTTMWRSNLNSAEQKRRSQFFDLCNRLEGQKDLKYIGKIDTIDKSKPAILTTVDEAQLRFFFTLTTSDGKLGELKVPLDMMGKLIAINGKPAEVKEVKDSYFVTEYAKTNEREFLSETFAYYCLKKITEASNPTIYREFEELIQKYKR